MDFLEQLKQLLGGRPSSAAGNAPRSKAAPGAMPRSKVAPGLGAYPGRTNYGVSEDNMIDTPSGYMTRQQYDMYSNPTPQLGAQRPFQVDGATNILSQLRRGRSAYTPGEGPQTKFRY